MPIPFPVCISQHTFTDKPRTTKYNTRMLVCQVFWNMPSGHPRGKAVSNHGESAKNLCCLLSDFSLGRLLAGHHPKLSPDVLLKSQETFEKTRCSQGRMVMHTRLAASFKSSSPVPSGGCNGNIDPSARESDEE